MTLNEERRIRLEMALENNVATWLRQTVTTTSIAVAVLVYFEVRGELLQSPLAIASISLLLITALMMGIMTSISYRRRKKKLIDEGILTDSTMNHWYLVAGILTVLGLFGVGLAVVRNKSHGG
jgi:uncharacterized membrane protein YidH (DUF202 family)